MQKNIYSKLLRLIQSPWMAGLWVLFCLSSCLSSTPGSQPIALGEEPAVELAVNPSIDFQDPERVTILGYEQDAMEPSISPDGQYLLFNNWNGSSGNQDLQYATRIDDLTFQYQGEIQGVNTAELEGVPTMAENNRIFFVSVADYAETLSSIYQGDFNDGYVTNIQLVENISRERLGFINFDVEISRDGDTLYFVDSWFGFNSNVPKVANMVFARRIGSDFEVDPSSDQILRKINTSAWEYAMTLSADQLELYFTRYNPRRQSPPVILVATRLSPSLPWGLPRRLRALQGYVEAPTLSPDENSLYYHKKEDDRFVIYRVTR